MQITITKQHEMQVHVPVPCYWSNGIRWIALIADNLAITFANYGDQVEIKNLTGKLLNSYLADTQEDNNYQIILEEDFFEHYDKAVSAITITPIAKTW